MIGNADIGVGRLAAGITGAPALSFALLAYSPVPFAGPFGNGTLCLSPFAPGLVRAPITRTDAAGAASIAMDFQSYGLGAAFTAGTTWYFQGIYRDTAGAGNAGFNTSDSVALTFGG